MPEFAPVFQLSSLDGSNGFRLDGVAADDFSGRSVASAGDVNGDGFDDLIFGAYGADPGGSQSGSSYVVFGKALGFAPSADLAALDGSDGFRLDGVAAFDFSGASVASAGDVNGDGFDDVIVGALLADPNGNASAGASYVVFGTADGFASSLNLSTLDGTNGFRLDGVAVEDRSGRSVASAGDVNGDGFDDVIIGAHYADPNGQTNAGSAYVVFGRSLWTATSQLSSLDGTDGFRIDGGSAFDISGSSVASAGDVNGDGFDDMIIGAPRTDPDGQANAGSAYVVFGRSQSTATVQLSSLDGDNGFRLDGLRAEDNTGLSVSSAGDTISGLAGNDTLLGWEGNDTITGGRGADDIDGGDGIDTAGYASSASAVNVDLVTGAGAGGHAQGDTLTGIENLIGSAFDDTLKGKGGANGLFGGAGNDVLRGRGGADDMRGGDDDDILIGGAGGDKLFGGGGVDVLVGSGGDDKLKDGAGNDALRGGGGDDVLAGGGGGDLLNGGPGNDTLLGGGGGDTVLGGLGRDVLSGGLGADTFVYQSVGDVGSGASKDVIKDFAPGIDTLDLAKIDANTTLGGNQAFTFVGVDTFSAAGQLRYVSGTLAGDVDGDGEADFQLRFANTASLSADDMLL